MNSQSDMCDVGTLEPLTVWSLFARISAIPRLSKKEEAIRRGVGILAEEMGLEVREDPAGNMVIEAPASPGCEGAPITVLQGHLDMVGEKNADSDHDFERDPIRLIVDREGEHGELIVRADGTTLGADNGIGLAMGLAAASSPEVTHGPLELLLTVDEETGMTGANALTPGAFRGRRMLNLDSEEDDVLCIGCAGGCDTTLSFEFAVEEPSPDDAAFRVKVSGLRGGHSGSDIHENRSNAVKLLIRVLLRSGPDRMRLALIHGGQLRNAIAREAEAVVTGAPDLLQALNEAAATVTEEVIRESDPERPSIEVEPVAIGEIKGVLSTDNTWSVVATLAALPHGVMGMHPEISDLVETSNNVATVASSIPDKRRAMGVEIGTLSRSSSASRQQAVLSQIAAVGKLAGAAVSAGNTYPGWEPDMDSPILAMCVDVYKELFGEEPRVTAIHAGLECGLIGERVGDMDMIALGPRIEGAHTPKERVYVASVQKSWKFLQAVLAKLASE